MLASLAVQAVLRLKGSGNLETIQITRVKKLGGEMSDSYLEEDQGYLQIETVHFCAEYVQYTAAGVP